MAKHNARWSAAQDDRLIELWRERNSVTEICISGEFNGFSRNAVIGRIYRLRKKWGTTIVPEHVTRETVPAPRKKRQRGKTNNFNVREPVLFVRDPRPIKLPPAPPKARRIPLLELGPRDCRFIVTDEKPHLYCAVDASAFADQYGGNCYCRFHQRFMRAGGDR